MTATGSASVDVSIPLGEDYPAGSAPSSRARLAEQNALWAMGLGQRTAVIGLGRIQLAGRSDVLRHNEDMRRAYLGT